MIPKTIHYCWYGNGAYNDVLKKCLSSWKEKLPDYKIKKWDETNTPFDKLPFLRLLYKQKKWAFISDYMRLYALYQEGGIYLDTDIEVLKPFDDLLTETVFFGIQDDIKLSVATGFIGSEKSNSFILKFLHRVEKKQKLTFNAMGGPNVLTKLLSETQELKAIDIQKINGVTIFSPEYFYPLPWKVSFDEAPKHITKKSFCIHWWQESWTTKKHDYKYYIDSLLRKIEKLPLVINSTLKYTFNNKSFYHICNLNDI